MEQGENFTKEAWDALSPEQQEEALRIEKSVDAFLADSRAIRYVETDSNKTALLTFLEEHNLQVSHANLLFSYDSLCAEGALELIPLVAPAPPTPSQPPIPVPTAPTRQEPTIWRNGKKIKFREATRL